MTAANVDISGLNAAERLALIERLWRSLTDELEKIRPPDWHEEELQSRGEEWKERASHAEDWAIVREELKREIR
jgi:hypothetical protein